MMKDLWSFHGRVGRQTFALVSLATYIVSATANPLCDATAAILQSDLPKQSLERPAAAFGFAVGFALLLGADLLWLMTNVRRLHDLSLSGFLVILVFIGNHYVKDEHWPAYLPGPVLMLWTLVLLIPAGRRGPNPFGADPRQTPAEA